jgi:Leucine-rich repeat (LRR) protein
MKYLFLFALALPAAAVDDTGWIETAGGRFTTGAAGQITAVDFRASWVTDADLRRLAKLPGLTKLDLSLTRITDQGMQELKSLPGVVELNLRFAEYVTDEGLAAIKNWKNLRRLVLHGTKVSDTALDHIAGISTLESLDLGSVMLTDVALERLTVLPNLKALTIGGNELGDAGLQALRQMPELTYLDLSGRQGTDSNVWAISMSDVGLEAVLTLSKLQEIRFGCTSIGVGVEGARFATVSMMGVTPRWLEQLQSLKQLRQLTLQGCDRIDDTAIATLAKFPSLEQVDLKGTAVTEKGLAALRAARPKLRVFHGPWDAKAANFRNN